jgi:hypothetical protein
MSAKPLRYGGPALRIYTNSFWDLMVSAPFVGFQLVVRGGAEPYTFGLAPGSGALPTGITVNPSTGFVGGTPTQAGDFAVIFQVTDSKGRTAITSAIYLNVSTHQLVWDVGNWDRRNWS